MKKIGAILAVVFMAIAPSAFAYSFPNQFNADIKLLDFGQGQGVFQRIGNIDTSGHSISKITYKGDTQYPNSLQVILYDFACADYNCSPTYNYANSVSINGEYIDAEFSPAKTLVQGHSYEIGLKTNDSVNIYFSNITTGIFSTCEYVAYAYQSANWVSNNPCINGLGGLSGSPYIAFNGATPPPPTPTSTPTIAGMITVPTSTAQSFMAQVSGQLGNSGLLRLLVVAVSIPLVLYILDNLISLVPKRKK